MTEKGLKANVKKRRRLLKTGKKTASMKLPSFHAQFEQEEWEVTSFYVSNVTVGCIKDALEYESASARH